MYMIGDKLSCNFYGFMKGKGISDCVSKCLSNDAEKCTVFVDLQEAFDKTYGEVIMYELATLGISGKLLTWIGQKKNNKLGIPQGGVLSPMLFNVLMNRIDSKRCPQGI